MYSRAQAFNLGRGGRISWEKIKRLEKAIKGLKAEIERLKGEIAWLEEEDVLNLNDTQDCMLKDDLETKIAEMHGRH